MFANRRNIILAGVLILIAFSIMIAVYLEIAAASQSRVAAWMVTQPIAAGETITPANVTQTEVQTQDVSLLQHSPIGAVATHSLQVNDLLRGDDIGSASKYVQVALTLSNTPVLAVGQMVDVYTEVNNNTVLLGKHLTVVSSGGATVVNVSVTDEAYWVSLIATGTKLYGAVVPAANSSSPAIVSNANAVTALSGLSQNVLNAGSITSSTLPSPLP